MPESLPKRFYRVTSKGAHRSYYDQLEGRTFAHLGHAKNHRDKIRRFGGESEIYVCEPDWKLVEED